MTPPAGISSRIRLLFALLLVWAVVILWLSLDPSPPVPQHDLFGWDKLQHAAAYALLTFLAGTFWSAFSGSSFRTWMLAAVSAVAYGGVVEVLQACYTTDRVAEAGDLLADAVGAVFVVVLVIIFRRFGTGRLAGR